MSRHERTISMIGEEAMNKLENSRVLVFGVGGVGGYVCEALARAGVGAIDLCDNDVVSESNINRQIIATYDTVGMAKTEAMMRRILSVNPACTVTRFDCFYLPDTLGAERFDFSQYVTWLMPLTLFRQKSTLLFGVRRREHL